MLRIVSWRETRVLRRQFSITALATVFLCLTAGCKSNPEAKNKAAESSPTPAASTTNADDAAADNPQPEDATLVERLRREQWTGDLDGMRQRRYIRALVTYNKTYYFYDGAQARGISCEALREFEKTLNQKLQTGNQPVHIVFIPVRREELLKGLAEGRGDIAASNIAITPERQKLVDFSDPIRTGAKQIVVTGPSAPQLSSLDDLSGKEVYVRRSSRYYESLARLNQEFRKNGKPEINLKAADENLEDEDILQMVNAGLVGITATDDMVGGMWAKLLDKLTLHPDLAVANDDQIAWAFRKNSPQLTAAVNDFVKDHKLGTSYGNTLLKRYVGDTKWVKDSTTSEELKKFQATADYFRKYGREYGFDWLMVAAQGYQESRLDQTAKSSVGAVGVMQIKPSTAAGQPININDVDKMEPNIHAGVKYLRFMMDRYFKDAPMDRVNRGLFSFASYNAGPARVAKLRSQAEAEGLDPNRWFNNVELVAAREIGPETVTYVSNIYKYYIAYKLINEHSAARQKAVQSAHSK